MVEEPTNIRGQVHVEVVLMGLIEVGCQYVREDFGVVGFTYNIPQFTCFRLLRRRNTRSTGLSADLTTKVRSHTEHGAVLLDENTRIDR